MFRSTTSSHNTTKNCDPHFKSRATRSQGTLKEASEKRQRPQPPLRLPLVLKPGFESHWRILDKKVMAAHTTISTRSAKGIPWFYRFLLLNLEPICALSGAIVLLFQPVPYLSAMTRGSISKFDTSTNFIYTELAGAWFHFAFTEAVVLRLVDDVRVWRLLCASMLLADIAYCHSCAQAVGGWELWLQISMWTTQDWTVAITTWPFVLSRFVIVLGIGIRSREAKGRNHESSQVYVRTHGDLQLT